MKSPTTPATRKLLPAALALILLATACGGPGSGDDSSADSSESEASPTHETPGDGSGHDMGGDGSASGGHDEGTEDADGSGGHDGAGDHGTAQELAEDVPVPTIAIEVTEDAVEGWNLQIRTTDFRIMPENVSTGHVDGEGHMYLYIDGVKVSRIYGEWHHITGLQAGRHNVRVELSSNNHSALAVNGGLIDATANIFQDRRTNLSLVRDGAVEANEPHPSVRMEIVDDPAGGWNVHAVPANFRLAPASASSRHADGEGHMRLYINGERVTRLYETWYQMPPLVAGTHEIRVDLGTNDHAPLTVDGAVVDAVVTLEVSQDEATMEADDGHAMSDEGGTGSSGGHHGSAGAPTRYDADVADAAQTITVEVVGGAPVGGHQRVEVDLGSVVAVMVTSDTAEEVHVHGYDILRAVSDGHPAHFAFTAEIPGVFEVELEGSGRLLLQLEIS